MADLYTVNKSPFEKNSLEQAIRFAGDGASILLIEDGVYGAVAGTAAEGLIKGASGQAVQNLNLLFGLDETLGLK